MTRNEFEEALSRVTAAWAQHNFEEAFSLIETIRRDGTADMKADGLFFSGMIKQANGNILEARQDWLDALLYSPLGSFVRYNLQHNIGMSFEKENLVNEADKWYRAALQTCAEGDEFSGEQILAAYLSLHHGRIHEKDRLIISAIVEKSWRILDLPGTPPIDNPGDAISSLTEHFSKLVSNIVKES